MPEMRAIVISEYGAPEVLREELRPIPEPKPGSAIVRVRAFGLNHAESYFRRGLWGEVAKISGIECAGEVFEPSDTGLCQGQRVLALMGGMGRSIDGSYAQYVRVPSANVVPIESELDWTQLAAIPESYATAWTFLQHNLEVRAGQVILVRGGSSALGHALINIARGLDVRVLATTRSRDKLPLLASLGAEPLLETPELVDQVRARFAGGIDGVVDILGCSTVLESCRTLRYRGRAAIAGFLAGPDPLVCDPLRQLPSGVQLSFFASAFMFGSDALPLREIPFRAFVASAERGEYRAAPAHVFDFEQIVQAHQLMESGAARGKIVVRVP